MSAKQNKRVGNILIEMGHIDADNLRVACEEQRINPEKRIGEILLDRAYLSHEHLAMGIAEQFSLPYFEKPIELFLDAIHLPHSKEKDVFEYQGKPLKKIPLGFCSKCLMIPIRDNGLLTILQADPNQMESETWLTENGHKTSKIPVKIASSLSVRNALYDLERSSTVNAIRRLAEEMRKEGAVEDDKVRQFLMTIIEDAVQTSAADILIEPLSGITDIRYTVDKVKRHVCCIPSIQHRALVNVILNASDGASSGEFHQAHATRINFERLSRGKDGAPIFAPEKFKNIEMRVSGLPTKIGSKVGAEVEQDIVLRILGGSKHLYSLEQCGYREHHLKLIKVLVEEPQGCILVTGPVGSGKTTTLYSILQRSKSVEKKICTIEDPVEIFLPGITQVQVNENNQDAKKAITFPTITRAFLRHAIDVVLVGEIRDMDTAKVFLQIGMTGHKAYSTLHTNSAIESIARLFDLGVEPYQITSAVKGIVSQRLLRKLCLRCRLEDEVPKDLTLKFSEVKVGFTSGREGVIYRRNPEGCEFCTLGKGYNGATIAAEIFFLERWTHPFIDQRQITPIEEGLKTRNYFMSIDMDAIRLIKEGITTVEEYKRVIMSGIEVINNKAEGK